MKSLLSLLACLTLLPSLHAEDQIEVVTRFIEAKAGLQVPHDIAALNRLAGVDLLSTPRVTTKPGQKVEVAMEQDLKAPTGGFVAAEDKPFTGVRFRVVGDFAGEGIAYRLQVTKCDIVGVAEDGKQEETVSHDLYANGSAKDGETVWLTISHAGDERQRFVLVTFKRVQP